MRSVASFFCLMVKNFFIEVIFDWYRYLYGKIAIRSTTNDFNYNLHFKLISENVFLTITLAFLTLDYYCKTRYAHVSLQSLLSCKQKNLKLIAVNEQNSKTPPCAEPPSCVEAERHKEGDEANWK